MTPVHKNLGTRVPMDRTAPALTVAVLQQKGGSGKTTLAVNLAAAAHLEGSRTLVVDMDRQASAFDWSAARHDGSALEGLAVVKADRALSLPRLNEIARGYDYVFLDGCDGPPRLGDVTQSAHTPSPPKSPCCPSSLARSISGPSRRPWSRSTRPTRSASSSGAARFAGSSSSTARARTRASRGRPRPSSETRAASSSSSCTNVSRFPMPPHAASPSSRRAPARPRRRTFGACGAS